MFKKTIKLSLLSGTVALCGTLALAGPTPTAMLEPTDGGFASGFGSGFAGGVDEGGSDLTFESLLTQNLSSEFAPDLAGAGTTAAYEDTQLTGDILNQQHPMIPLPPSLWAGLTTLVAVAYYTIRSQRPTRQRV